MSYHIFNDSDAFATPLLLTAFNQLGMNIFEYEPESISIYVRSIAPKAPDSTMNKINAALSLFTTDLFWQDPVKFGIACRTFNRAAVPFAAEPTIEDIAWGITEARMLMTTGEDTEPDTFSTAIVKYIKYMLQQDNMLTVPDAFKELNIRIDNVNSFDDPQQNLSIQQRADSDAAAIDYLVFKQTIELLKQVQSLNIPFSDTAKEQLAKILNTYEASSSVK